MDGSRGRDRSGTARIPGGRQADRRALLAEAERRAVEQLAARLPTILRTFEPAYRAPSYSFREGEESEVFDPMPVILRMLERGVEAERERLAADCDRVDQTMQEVVAIHAGGFSRSIASYGDILAHIQGSRAVIHRLHGEAQTITELLSVVDLRDSWVEVVQLKERIRLLEKLDHLRSAPDRIAAYVDRGHWLHAACLIKRSLFTACDDDMCDINALDHIRGQLSSLREDFVLKMVGLITASVREAAVADSNHPAASVGVGPPSDSGRLQILAEVFTEIGGASALLPQNDTAAVDIAEDPTNDLMKPNADRLRRLLEATIIAEGIDVLRTHVIKSVTASVGDVALYSVDTLLRQIPVFDRRKEIDEIVAPLTKIILAHVSNLMRHLVDIHRVTKMIATVPHNVLLTQDAVLYLDLASEANSGVARSLARVRSASAYHDEGSVRKSSQRVESDKNEYDTEVEDPLYDELDVEESEYEYDDEDDEDDEDIEGDDEETEENNADNGAIGKAGPGNHRTGITVGAGGSGSSWKILGDGNTTGRNSMLGKKRPHVAWIELEPLIILMQQEMTSLFGIFFDVPEAHRYTLTDSRTSRPSSPLSPARADRRGVDRSLSDRVYPRLFSFDISITTAAIRETVAARDSASNTILRVVKPNVEHVIQVYPLVKDFCLRTQSELLGETRTSLEPLSNYFESFVHRVYLPFLRGSYRSKVRSILDDAEAFKVPQQPDPLAVSTPLTFLPAVMAVYECVKELVLGLFSMGSHADRYIEIIESICTQLAEGVEGRLLDMLNGTYTGAYVDDEAYVRMLKAGSAWAQNIAVDNVSSTEEDLPLDESFGGSHIGSGLLHLASLSSASTVSIPLRNTNADRQAERDMEYLELEAESEERFSKFGERVKEERLVSGSSEVRLLAVLAHSLFHMASRVSRYIEVLDARTPGAVNSAVAITKGSLLREVVARLRQLAEKSIIAVHREVRMRTMLYLDRFRNTTFRVKDEVEEADAPIVDMIGELGSIQDGLNGLVDSRLLQFVAAGLDRYICTQFLRIARSRGQLSPAGVRKLAQNLQSLQQGLAVRFGLPDDVFEQTRGHLMLLAMSPIQK